MLEDIVYVVIYGFVFASLYGIMTVGFSFICGLGGFYDIALPAYLMVGGFLYVMLSEYIGGWALPVVVLATGINSACARFVSSHLRHWAKTC